MEYALVKIKVGASVSQDFSYGKWPACKPPKEEHEGDYEYFTRFPDAVFIGEKRVTVHGVTWDCKREGYGMMCGGYGNGSIYVRGDDCVEMLTPLLGFAPSLDDLVKYQNNNKEYSC